MGITTRFIGRYSDGVTVPFFGKKNEEYKEMYNYPKSAGYVNHSIWQNTPETLEEFIKDPRFQKMGALAKDAAVAKFLHMSYGKLQEYKYNNNLTW